MRNRVTRLVVITMAALTAVVGTAMPASADQEFHPNVRTQYLDVTPAQGMATACKTQRWNLPAASYTWDYYYHPRWYRHCELAPTIDHPRPQISGFGFESLAAHKSPGHESALGFVVSATNHKLTTLPLRRIELVYRHPALVMLSASI
ncbi:hypothetical protein OG555_24530 [Kribbella sp. NBC_01484]|uniref:hypothetical protein n=1 Tax=Kribbella sp. NBC_01484 TaxID=2903579 RepID=UPI002E2EF5C1|nr:hypothetical protein [Kribbella sp. NBC_01484]